MAEILLLVDEFYSYSFMYLSIFKVSITQNNELISLMSTLSKNMNLNMKLVFNCFINVDCVDAQAEHPTMA
jgi:hypothetical protein